MRRAATFLVLTVSLISWTARALDFPDIPGWKPVGKPATFDTSTIWQAINGAAEMYIAYNFQLLTTQSFQKDDLQVSLNVYDQALPLNAWGVYHRERSPNAEIFAAGAEAAYTKPYQCVMLKSHHYVKAEALKGEITKAACQELMTALAKALPGKDGLPGEINRLPKQGRVAGSLGYTRLSYLGLSELKNCLHADYQPKGRQEPYLIFTILPEAGANAEEIWKQLSSKWKSTKLGKHLVLHREIPYRGPVALTRTPVDFLGVTDAGNLKSTLVLLQKLTSS